MKEAAFSLAEAKFATGDFNQVVIQNVTKAQIKIRTKKDNVAGMYGFHTYSFLTDFDEVASRWIGLVPAVIVDEFFSFLFIFHYFIEISSVLFADCLHLS